MSKAFSGRFSMSSSRDSEEEISSRTSEVAKNTNKRINEFESFDISNHEQKRARKEVETYDKSANEFEHLQFSKIVKLNVGGHFFSTSLETLTKDSGSMLHALFSGRFETKPSGTDGSYFVDRDGTHFRYILNYLRTGQLIVPEDKIVRRELLAEAEFYQVEGIINELTARPFKLDSIIVPSDQRQTLLNWLKDTQALTTGSLFPVLLYRASRDGWTGDKFHSFCDKKGPTVIVIKGGNEIFGGYTEEQWKCASEVTIKRQDTFLFRLENPREDQNLSPMQQTIFGPIEQTMYGRCTEHAVGYLRKQEPVFKDGCDFVSVNAPNDSNNCSVSLNSRKYMADPCLSSVNTGLFGEQRLGPSGSVILHEIEVFGFDKLEVS